MNKHHESTGPADEQQITLRGPAELADALPYLMGFHPNDSVVMVALHGGRGRFGGRLRLGIPRAPQEWAPVAGQLAESLIAGSERRGSRPDAIVVFLCQDPAEGESAHGTMERLRPLAQCLRTACGALDVPVLEALCISDGRYWSYCCPDARCCPEQGNPLAMPGTTVMAAAAAYAGIQVRGSLRDMEERLSPWRSPAAPAQCHALDTAGASLVSRLLDKEGRVEVAGETLELARVLMRRLRQMPPSVPSAADRSDDQLISHDEAAAVILGLQDRETRDKAAEWMEGPEADSALRLWRALSRRCVGPYVEHAAAPLALAGWVSWSTGDEPGARVALGLALRADPDYTFAQLLHQACNEGLDPETLRRCLRGEDDSAADGGVPAGGSADGGVPAGDLRGGETEEGETGSADGWSGSAQGPPRECRARPRAEPAPRPARPPRRTPDTKRRKGAPAAVRPGGAAARRGQREAGRYGGRGTGSGR
ncbi:DUF4192 domain-containing protein [Streptomyces sp. BE147]|uniref:DUF4192 domain-containing protein n=1 Tax=Streptomyces sp. BE147 TaxID=3002524 RepID=UPI002E77FD26|nr:DUF4192 domain-containing protein [Streptomyces sp. BE147]MEE1742342.1 DUF4192 domain-containing protein [Streptomyces sp. BE147]